MPSVDDLLNVSGIYTKVTKVTVYIGVEFYSQLVISGHCNMPCKSISYFDLGHIEAYHHLYQTYHRM